MERAIAEMEKIRKAEEIYSRRKNEISDDKRKNKNIYKTLFEILFFIDIVVLVIAIQNQQYIFTKQFIEQVNSYQINMKQKIEEMMSPKAKIVENTTIIDKTEENFVEENKSVSGESNDVSSALVENEPPLSQEEQDILEIQNHYSVILPVSGIKTSGFGERESANTKVTKYHTGVDIAATSGTPIQSAISGIVVQVSSAGDYGKHIQVQSGELTTLYAHCSKIYVTEGQEVVQGEKIGEVGSTGNSTGPHLHFEIRLCDRLVNPEAIISIG